MSDRPQSTPIGREILAGLEEFADLLEAVREVERLRSDLQSARVEISQLKAELKAERDVEGKGSAS